MAKLVKLWKGSRTVDKNVRLKRYVYSDGSTHYEFRDRFGKPSNVTKDEAEKIIKQWRLVEAEI